MKALHIALTFLLIVSVATDDEEYDKRETATARYTVTQKFGRAESATQMSQQGSLEVKPRNNQVFDRGMRSERENSADSRIVFHIILIPLIHWIFE